MAYIGCGLCIYFFGQLFVAQRIHAVSWIDKLPWGGFLTVEHDDAGLVFAYAPPQQDSRATPPISYPYSRIFRNFNFNGTIYPEQLNVTFNPSGKLVPVRLHRMPEYVPWAVLVALSLLIFPLGMIDMVHIWRFFVGRRRILRGCCPACGYDLRATPDRCPECGTFPEKKA